MSNRDAYALLGFGLLGVLAGALLGDRGAFLLPVGAVGALAAVGILLWNLAVESRENDQS